MSYFTPTFKREPITVCGRDVFVQEWSGKVRETYERQVDGSTCVRALVAFLSLVDGDGKPLETTVEELAELPLTELAKINDLALKVNSLSKAQIDEAEKN